MTHRRILKVGACLLLVGLIIGCATARIHRHPHELRFTPLKFAPPKAERTVLNNGIVLYVLEDHDLPLFNAVASFRAGSIYEPADKVGLASLTGTVARTGGTTSMTGDEIDDELEFMAGSVEINVVREGAVGALNVLAKNMNRGLEIFADVLRNPVFSEDKIDLAKKAALEEIRRRYDTPDSIAAAEFPKLIYGENSVWARFSTETTINDISRDDLIQFHKKYYVPNNVILGISGDFNKEQLIAKVNALFGGWSPAEVSFPRVEDEKPMSVHSVNYIYKDVNQSSILMGHLGIRRHNPDEISVEIMNYILGWGGFTSKLWKEVRQDRGLAYDVFGGITAGLDYGVFEAGCQTSGRTTCEAITVIRDVITEMTESPPSDAELALAKEGRLNRFVFNFASTAQIVRQRVTLEFLGYPLDYLDTYEAKIAAVTRDDVHRVATTYLHPDRLVVLVVGNSAQFDKPLSTLGEVNAIEIPRNAASSALMERTVPVFGYAPPSTLLFARIQR